MQAPVQDSSTPGASGQPTQGHHSKPDGSSVPILTILGMTCFMSAMAGFGALPFFFCGKLKQSWAGIANAVACGVMLSASFDLLHEGAPYSPFLTIVGMLAGAIFIKSSQEFLSQFDDASFQDLNGADARKAMLIVGVMAAHAFGEGSGVGVSFSGHRGWAQGTLVTIAIGLHNIPEGMAVATVMVAKGAPPRKALFWSLFCAFPQALVAVPSFMFVETFQALLPMALGFAAGCMIWIVCAELMPDALEAAPHPQVATAATCSAAW
ncbi:zinc permease family [Haematococcus lacustris]